MKPINVIMPENVSPTLNKMVKSAIPLENSVLIKNINQNLDLKNKKLVFVVELDEAGLCLPILNMFSMLYKLGSNLLLGSEGILLIHSNSDLYTKSSAATIIFLANGLGCRFIGHPVVEATKSFNNFSTWQKTLNLSLEEICMEQCKKLGKRFIEDTPIIKRDPNLLVLHASLRTTSNTLLLWNMIKNKLSGCIIKELNVENGTVKDCTGCSFKTCMHYSAQNSCFYGGIMVEDIYPAIENADAILWVCPNYNDALSANLTAVINRMTALYRKTPFYDKTLFSIIVSGSSGSDSVAKQLLNALNINKGFRLPPNFAIMETANDPKSISKVFNIEKKAEEFSKNILNEIKI
ncbi:MAG: NAD(P)H-dependent oxidoreductase [Clostridiales bacterium]|nr:NAD(P)H-dependent oxidoreductase [Clostridiales bacterium]